MRVDPSLLWTWNRMLDRGPYLLAGLALMVVKFGIDWTIATQIFGRAWTPMNYLIWPDYAAVRVWELPSSDRWFSLTLLFVSLPFIWTGVMLTVHRLNAAKLPMAMAAMFFVPLLNLLLFFLLSLAETRPPATGAVDSLHQISGLESASRESIHGAKASVLKSALFAMVVTVTSAFGVVVLGALVLKSYGFGLFVAVPFAVGLISAVLFGWKQPQSRANCLLLAMVAITVLGVALVFLFVEGLLCLVMAAPIVYILVIIGALVGHAIQARSGLRQHPPILCLILFALPGLMTAESGNQPAPRLHAVRSSVIINAPLDRVWQQVIAFPPLPEPTDWLFRSGVAYPQRAEIRGAGVGAIRRCIFSTGTFLEPIETWEPDKLLQFRVVAQPPPMREWSPYDIDPPHLRGFLESRRGQFLLDRLPDGRTRLEGTTWYSNRMWPAAYWQFWADHIIHRIHLRVLDHIKRLSESSWTDR